MAKQFIPFSKPILTKKEIDEVVKTLKSGWLTTGPKTHLFEEQFKSFVKAENALALNSCTAGLFLALEVIGIKPGDEVITTPLTFAATANVIVHHGARPVFVDIDPKTFNIDPDAIEKAITKKTKVIIPVHLYGRPCNMDPIMKIAKKYNLKVIEDSAHASEALYKNKKTGTIGDIGCFSFYATKNIITGEGGMLVTNNKKYADEARIKSLHGLDKDAWKRYSSAGKFVTGVKYAGYKFNMMDIQASLGIHQLKSVLKNLRKRNSVWRTYNAGFKNNSYISLQPCQEPNTRHARHLYVIQLNLELLNINREQFMQQMRNAGIGTSVHFTALHLTEFYKNKFGYKKGDLPIAEKISERIVSLPLSPYIKDNEIKQVIKAVNEITKKAAKS